MVFHVIYALMEIVVATRNPKKVEEIRRILKGMPVRLLSLDDFPGCPEVEETGSTFEENAVSKALSVSKYTGKSAIADDSGLEVFSLGGAPGVRSARYAGERATDRDNVEKLLKELAGVPGGKRTARFVCVIALADTEGDVVIFSGHVEGRIAEKPYGGKGFGYDPVFYPEDKHKTFAMMSPPEKDTLSHRGRALLKLRQHFIDYKKN